MDFLYVVNLLLAIIFLIGKTWAQESEDYDDGSGRKNFLEPKHLGDEADLFVYNQTEYIFVNNKMPCEIAAFICKENYAARLAFVKDFDLGHFLAEALTETNLIIDSLWLGAKKAYKVNEWYWVRGKSTERISQEIVDDFVYNTKVPATDRECLTFSRMDHDIPQFRPIECKVLRAAMCERPRFTDHKKDSTHNGWIKLGKRHYKIFSEQVNWETAVSRCFDHHHDSTLAVLTTYEHCQHLGRYLLVGRPSLENAWTDGRFFDSNYKFEQENLILANESDKTGYPPWRNEKIQRTGGCILLDRHLSNITLFVEARCSRLRPYICYKFEEGDSEHDITDVIIGNHGYRLHYNKMNWDDAFNHCKKKYENYSAFLSEVREKVQLYQLLYVMGENRTAIKHIWLGGRFHHKLNPPMWLWKSDDHQISTGEDALLNWVKNKTYVPEIEEHNVCLKMDRENHIVALNYGAVCAAQLCFVCSFTAEELRRLQADESAYLNMAIST